MCWTFIFYFRGTDIVHTSFGELSTELLFSGESDFRIRGIWNFKDPGFPLCRYLS